MLNFLPPLYEGHAPITLQHLFGEALDALADWEDERPEPAVIFEDRLMPISTVFESMTACTDILPRTMADVLADTLSGPEKPLVIDNITFADASRLVVELVSKRRLYGDASIGAFMNHQRTDKRRPV